MAYSTPADQYAHGVPRGSVPNPGRVLASAVSGVCTLGEHGFETGDEILFRPAGAGDMPVGLSEGVTYYAELVNGDSFRVRTTAGGSAIDFTADDPLLVIAPLNRAAAIEWADRVIDDMVPGQAVPFDNATLYPAGVPSIIRLTSAELAANKLLAVIGASTTSLAAVADAAQRRLMRWSDGLPIRSTPTPTTRTNLSAPAPTHVRTTSPCNDSRGWRRWGC